MADTDDLLDVERLARWMDAEGLPGKGEKPAVSSISGGASNEILSLTRGGESMVLRRPPRNIPKGRNDTMLREYRVLSALRDSDVPHPRVLGASDDPKIGGGAFFYVMEYVDGWSPMSMGDTWPAPFDADLDARRGLAFELIDGIAKLALVDWQAAGLTGFGKPDNFLERQVDRWLAHLEKARFREIRELDLLAVPLESRGLLYFVPPDRLARFTLEPAFSALVVEGESVRFREGSDQDAIDLSGSPTARVFVDHVIALWSGDLERLQKLYSIDYSIDGSRWALTLVPRRAPLDRFVTRIALRGDELKERRLDLEA